MSHEEALGLAQILLGLLFFTLGIPVLIIEISSQGRNVRHLLHKRFRRWPRVLTGVTLIVVVILIIRSGVGEPGGPEEVTAKIVAAVIIVMFVVVWLDMIRINMRIVLISDITREIESALKKRGSEKDADLEDLVMLGEQLTGEEKTAVLRSLEGLCRSLQSAPGYDGTELEGFVRGVQRVVAQHGGDEHHATAIRILSACWRELYVTDQRGVEVRDYREDHDGDVVLETACTLAETAVSSRSESLVLRWLSAIPDTVQIPYRIGRAAILERRFRIVIAAFNHLALIAEKERRLPRELIALTAYCADVSQSATAMARGFLEHLGYFAMEIAQAAQIAANEFRDDADYATADAILRHFKSEPPGPAGR